ncbi:MAG TPA: thiamine diphosphokinase [Bacilli bacterium]|nr:thiamine diphosphokinase [Bacilli bacterium]
MIAKIVCAGFDSFKDIYQYDENEFIIAVDGGIIATSSQNIIAKVAIGDFDSSDIERYGFAYETKIAFPQEKNASDLELAIEYVAEMDFSRIEIYNGSGNRLDHFLSIIRVMAKYSHLNIHLLDNSNDIFIAKGTVEFIKDQYKYISFFAIENDTKITLQGFKYNLDNYILQVEDNICLSNEILEIGKLIVDKKVIVVKSLG